MKVYFFSICLILCSFEALAICHGGSQRVKIYNSSFFFDEIKIGYGGVQIKGLDGVSNDFSCDKDAIVDRTTKNRYTPGFKFTRNGKEINVNWLESTLKEPLEVPQITFVKYNKSNAACTRMMPAQCWGATLDLYSSIREEKISISCSFKADQTIVTAAMYGKNGKKLGEVSSVHNHFGNKMYLEPVQSMLDFKQGSYHSSCQKGGASSRGDEGVR